jgi:hypothetical protein
MPNVTIKQHDTKIVFKDTPMVDGVALAPADLVGCTLKFILKNRDGVLTRTGTINPDATFQYEPVDADVANVTEFTQEWEVTFPSNKVLTFPNDS